MAEIVNARAIDLGSEALGLKAKTAAFGQGLVGVWELGSTVDEPPKPEALECYDLLSKPGTEEAVFGSDDGRKLVKPKDYAPGGKYRSIVKLFCQHEKQQAGSWMQGTGWLIRPDLLVTAGHCTYDWGHGLGKVVAVRAYIGYHGRQHVNDKNVEFRYVKKVVAPTGWLRTKGDKPHDVGFMQLDKPFTQVKPFVYPDTPVEGNATIGVVGYPGDKIDAITQEKGAQMYEMFLQTSWNLAKNDNTMLQYEIDTFGGNSGSPVLIQGSNASLGVHVYGGSVNVHNEASVIGKYGNIYQDFINAFDSPIPQDGALHFVAVSRHQSAPMRGVRIISGTRRRAGEQTSGPQDLPHHYGQPVFIAKRDVYGSKSRNTESLQDEEGFFDIVKAALSTSKPVIGNVLRGRLPIALGVIGGPVGALASVALGAAAKMAKSIEASGGAESDDPFVSCEGVVERALLAEAVLQTLQKISLNAEEEETIFSDMKDNVMKQLPVIKNVAGKLLPAIMEPVLRMTLDSLHNYNQTASGTGVEGFGHNGTMHQQGLENYWRPVEGLPPHSEDIDQPTSNSDAESFLFGMNTATNASGYESSGGQEGFSDFIKAALRKGEDVFGKLMSLAKADHAVAEAYMGSNTLPATSQGTSAGLSIDALTKRALLAEAALRAVSKIPSHRLEEEGFFSSAWDIVKRSASKVRQAAPMVLDNVLPIASQLAQTFLSKGLGAESSFSGSSKSREAGTRRPPGVLRKQRSAILLPGEVEEFISRANKALAY